MQELKINDIIKIKSGSGPYYLISDENGDSSKCLMGYSGKYKVISIKEDGVVATKYPESDGFSFIYLGKNKIGETGMIMRPHKIEKIGEDGKVEGRSKQRKTRKNSSKSRKRKSGN